jgi:translation initiation factor 1A
LFFINRKVFIGSFSFCFMVFQDNSDEAPKVRVKLPRGKELIGIVDQRVGGGRMLIKCSDGKTRNCKVPGRLRRALWIREGNYVLVQPWEFDDSKADVLFNYNPNAVQVLKERGLLDGIDEGF